MFTVKQFMRAFKLSKGRFDVWCDNKCTVCTKDSLTLPTDLRHRGVHVWEISSDDVITIRGNNVVRPAQSRPTVSSICGTCATKTLLVVIDGRKPRRIYNIHPVRENRRIRSLSVKGNVLYINTWPFTGYRSEVG